MNLKDELPAVDRMISVKNILKEEGNATLIKIKENGVLKEHQSKTNALLILLSGKATYEEADRTVLLSDPHDFVRIPEKLTHKVTGEEDSLLLLIQ
jgi:mannose-6-phosphate isomerase-like protein (cupin superfamily)